MKVGDSEGVATERTEKRQTPERLLFISFFACLKKNLPVGLDFLTYFSVLFFFGNERVGIHMHGNHILSYISTVEVIVVNSDHCGSCQREVKTAYQTRAQAKREEFVSSLRDRSIIFQTND